MSARVNQKLYYARLVLDQAAAAAAGPLQTALQEAAVWHLATAYRAHLAAIAQGYRHDTAADSAATVARELAAREIHCAEIGELEQIERSGGWAAQLLSAASEGEALLPAKTTAADPQAVAVPALIPTQTVAVAWDVDDVRRWLEALSAAVTAQRERLQEW